MKNLNSLYLLVISCLWIINECLVILFLLLDMSNIWYQFSGFMMAHIISILLTLWFISAVVAGSKALQRIIDKSLFTILFFISCIPLVGPISVLVLALSLKYAPVTTLAKEEKEAYSIDTSLYDLLNYKVIALIHGQQSYSDSVATLSLLDRLSWTPHKSRILQMLLEFSKYPSAILGAASTLNQKKSEILNRLATLDKQDEPSYFQLANLYHEIYYLGLVDAHLSKFYLDEACLCIDKALEKEPYNLAAYNMGVKYYLENKQVDKAESIFKQAMAMFRKEDLPPTVLESYMKEIALLKGSTSPT